MVRRRIVDGLVALLATWALVARPLAAQQPAGRRPAPAAPVSLPLDCTSCHPSVHATMADSGQRASARCETCHAGAHEAVRVLYSGQGAADAVLHPDRMFLARVECRSCHTDSALADTAAGSRLVAITRACTSCHGSRFANMLPRWSEAMARHGRSAGAYLAAAQGDGRLRGRAAAQAQLQSAAADVALVAKGDGLHNVPGADALLRSATRHVQDAYRAAGLPVPLPPALGPDPAVVSCGYCHYGVETVRDTVFGQTFDHGDHVLRADVACTTCHSPATFFVGTTGQVDPTHGRTTVTAAGCTTCHHVTSALSCTTCHVPRALASQSVTVTLPLHLRPPGAPTARGVAFPHGAHSAVPCTSCHTSRTAIATVAACTTCHEAHHRDAADCTACHGTNLLAAHTVANHLACAQCHARATLELLTGKRAFCLSCHVDRRDHHPNQECAPCHLQMSPAEVRARILGIPR